MLFLRKKKKPQILTVEQLEERLTWVDGFWLALDVNIPCGAGPQDVHIAIAGDEKSPNSELVKLAVAVTRRLDILWTAGEEFAGRGTSRIPEMGRAANRIENIRVLDESAQNEFVLDILYDECDVTSYTFRDLKPISWDITDHYLYEDYRTTHPDALPKK